MLKSIKVPLNLHTKIKTLASNKDKTIQKFLDDLIYDYIENNQIKLIGV